MTRLESGALELRRDWADPSDLVASALAQLTRRLSGHQVVVEAEPGVPLVKVDFVLMEQVLVNLLDNAVKFNRPGGEVWVESEKTGDGRLRISVADNGIGIPSDDLPRIFERFYRVDKARSREVGGTGLGLSIVKHAVERMGGKIAVESQLGKGSKFTVLLPAE
jgi:signal transduction histidine kinase